VGILDQPDEIAEGIRDGADLDPFTDIVRGDNDRRTGGGEML
jgi:hypothetical protein